MSPATAWPIGSAEELRRLVAPVPLRDVLCSLRRARVIRAFEVGTDDVVRIEADRTALELLVLQLQDAPGYLGDDLERGFMVSSSITDRRGSSTARAGDFEAVRAYYAAARAFTWEPAFTELPAVAQRAWRLHAAGLSDSKIAARLRLSRRCVCSHLAVVRVEAGLAPRGARHWAVSPSARALGHSGALEEDAHAPSNP